MMPSVFIVMMPSVFIILNIGNMHADWMGGGRRLQLSISSDPPFVEKLIQFTSEIVEKWFSDP